MTENKCSSKLPAMNQNELDELIRDIAKENTRPVIDTTLREIAAQVKAKTGYEPSTSVVSAALQRIQAKAKGHRWAWVHKGEAKQ